MMVYNVRFSRNRLVTVGLVLLLVALICISYAASAEHAQPNASDLAARLGFLENFGHYCDGETESSKQVVIPEEFGEVYISYNNLQRLQGYDLARYKGQEAILYTYRVLNYSGEDEVYAHLLVKNGVVIGGDIASARLDGFMEGFAGQRLN